MQVGVTGTVLGAVGLALSLCGCQRIEVARSVYEPERLMTVQPYVVALQYEKDAQTLTAGAGSATYGRGHMEAAGVSGTKSTRNDDLQFKDDFEFRLRDRHGLTISRRPDEAAGLILLNTGYYIFAGHKSVDVLITDRNEVVLARIRITNGQNQAVIDDYQRFAEYCADVVGEVIRGKGGAGAP